MFRDALGETHARAAAGARIVSLVPSITELLFDLGLGRQVVGRTGFCIHPRDGVRTVPKLGGTKDVDLYTLRALKPSHVIVNIDENTRDTYDALGDFVPHVVVTHPNGPEDNLELYRLLGGIFDREREADTLCEAFENASQLIASVSAKCPPRRVLYLIWREPWMTITPDTYISRMLERIAWQSLPRDAAQRYPALDIETMRELEPGLCLLSSEPYPFRDKHIAEVDALVRPRLGTHLVDGEMLSWYGSRAIPGLEYLGQLARRFGARAA